MSVTFNRF